MQYVSALLGLLLPQLSAGIQLWATPGDLPNTIPAGCRAALTQNITCSPGLVLPADVAAGRSLGLYTTKQFCTDACYKSLTTLKANVDQRCGNTTYQFYNGSFPQSAMTFVDPLTWAFNVTCIQDNTGFCLPGFLAGNKTSCSQCALEYAQEMVSNDYGRGRVSPDDFNSLLSSCSVPASSYPYTYSPTAAPTPTPTGSPLAACTGTTYTVKSSDTCQSISSANSIAIDRFITENHLDYNCTQLTSGMNVCLGASCKLQVVQANQTCTDIIGSNGFNVVQLQSWNPFIHQNCDNLDMMVGRSICVSPPGTTGYSDETSSLSTPSISSMFSGPWTMNPTMTTSPTWLNSTSYYNTDTVFPTPPPITYTPNATVGSLLPARTTYCPLQPSDIDAGWNLADLPDACSTLLAPYCEPDVDLPPPTSTRFPAVCYPSYYETDTATSTNNNAAPTPLEPGTTPDCKSWYQVAGSDTCYSIATHFGISLDDFYKWNPNVKSDCSGLWLGYYVCIGV